MIQGIQFSRSSAYQAVSRMVRREIAAEQPTVENNTASDQPAVDAAQLDYAKFNQALRVSQKVEDSAVLREIE